MCMGLMVTCGAPFGLSYVFGIVSRTEQLGEDGGDAVCSIGGPPTKSQLILEMGPF